MFTDDIDLRDLLLHRYIVYLFDIIIKINFFGS